MEQEEQEEHGIGDTLVDALFSAANDDTDPVDEPSPDLGGALTLTETLESIDAPPRDEPPPPDEPPPLGNEPEPQPAKKKKVRRIVKKEVVDPSSQPTQTIQPQSIAAPPPVTEDPFVSELMDREREVYDMATFAEKRMGQTDLSKKYLEFFKKNKEYLDKRSSDDPNFDVRDDHDYKSFVQRTQPDFSAKQFKAVKEEMLMEKAESRAMDKMRPIINDLHRKQYLSEAKPRADQEKGRFHKSLFSAMPEDMQGIVKDKGLEGLATTLPMEFNAAKGELSRYQSMANFLIDAGAEIISVRDPDYQASAAHNDLDDWINRQQSAFIDQGTGQTRRDGKDFARREEFAALEHSQPGKYWTWSNPELLQLLLGSAKIRIDQVIEAKRGELAAAGYVRQRQRPPAAKRPAPPTRAAAPSRRAGPTPRPGGIPPSQRNEPKNTLLDVLGL